MIHMSTGITADPDLAIPILPFAPSSGSGVYRIMCSSLFLFPPIKDGAFRRRLFFAGELYCIVLKSALYSACTLKVHAILSALGKCNQF